MNIYTTQKVLQEVHTGYKCDVCGKVSGECDPKTWFHFNSGHHAWGNDSHESFRYWDVCSVECFAKQLKICLDNLAAERISAEIADMNYDFAISLYDSMTNGKQ